MGAEVSGGTATVIAWMIKLDQSALDALATRLPRVPRTQSIEGSPRRTVKPLAEAVGTVADEFAKAGLEPNRDGIRTKLVELGWEE